MVSHTVWFVLGHSNQRISVKFAEATWNYDAGGRVHLKSPAFFSSFFPKELNAIFRNKTK